MPLGEQLFGELHVLTGVCRPILDQDALARNAHGDSDGSELIRFELAPQLTCDGPEAAGENEERRPAVQEQLRAALGHTRIVAAQHEDRIGRYEPMMQLVVVPELLG